MRINYCDFCGKVVNDLSYVMFSDTKNADHCFDICEDCRKWYTSLFERRKEKIKFKKLKELKQCEK